jgi:NitT/TauT family transport system substrate-binding protein
MRAFILVLLACLAARAGAQTTLNFSLDFIMFGSNAPFVFADERGYFKDAGVAVKIDPSSGSGDAVNRLATGTYDIGYADVSTLVEFASKNPDVAPKVVLFIQDKSPAVILAHKKSGIAKPADLAGRSLGSGSTDAGARMFPMFARLNGVDTSRIDRQMVDFRLRDSLFAQGKFDAVIAFRDSLLSIRALGVDPNTVTVLAYQDYGLNLYGNAMIASRKVIQGNPDALRRSVEAAAKAWRDAIRNPAPAIDALAKRNNLTKRDVDLERLTFIIENQIVTPFTRAHGIGAVDTKRLDDHLKLIGEGFGLVRVPTRAEIYDERFVPPLAVRKFVD